jgi:hypothetical protein
MTIGAPNFGRFPEQFRNEGVFAHGMVLVKIGDKVTGIVNIQGNESLKGAELVIEDIIIEPKSEGRGFTKRIKFMGIEGEYNPKNFKKLS